MSKSKIKAQQQALEEYEEFEEEEEEEGFSDFLMDEPNEDAIFEMMNGLLEESKQQMQTSIELTKLVLEKLKDKPFTEEDIFSTFNRATEVVSNASPVKDLLDKVS